MLSIAINRILSIKSFKQVDVPTAFSDISQPLGQACSWDPSWHESSRSVLVKNWNRCWASVLHGYLIITKFKIKKKKKALIPTIYVCFLPKVQFSGWYPYKKNKELGFLVFVWGYYLFCCFSLQTGGKILQLHSQSIL